MMVNISKRSVKGKVASRDGMMLLGQVRANERAVMLAHVLETSVSKH
jgi:hypothetical protein